MQSLGKVGQHIRLQDRDVQNAIWDTAGNADPGLLLWWRFWALASWTAAPAVPHLFLKKKINKMFPFVFEHMAVL